MYKSPESILIVCIRLIGDVILTTPLIGLLRDACPDAAIDLLVERGTGEFLEKDPRVRQVLYFERGGSGYYRKIFQRYDLAINMNASDRGNLAVLLAGRSQRVGFYLGSSFGKDIWKRLFFTHAIKFPQEIPVARYCASIAASLAIPVKQLTVKVFWDQADENRVTGLISERVGSRPFFVVHPFARWIYKFWRFDRFAEASDAIARRYGLQPVWTSSPSPDEMIQLEKAAKQCLIQPVLLRGELTLNQMTCLLSHAAFYLGLDTAVTHLAASTGVPMVALYGPTFTKRWFPWDNSGAPAQGCPSTRGILQRGKIVVLQKDLECMPCGKAGCDDSGESESPCLTGIGVEDVLSAVELALKHGEICNEPSVIEENVTNA